MHGPYNVKLLLMYSILPPFYPSPLLLAMKSFPGQGTSDISHPQQKFAPECTKVNTTKEPCTCTFNVSRVTMRSPVRSAASNFTLPIHLAAMYSYRTFSLSDFHLNNNFQNSCEIKVLNFLVILDTYVTSVPRTH
jgi:hypothetical protein